MDVKEIVSNYLKKEGYDGLFDEFSACACKLDDLMPCDDCVIECKPGYLQPCDCGNDCDFHIVEEKNIR